MVVCRVGVNHQLLPAGFPGQSHLQERDIPKSVLLYALREKRDGRSCGLEAPDMSVRTHLLRQGE